VVIQETKPRRKQCDISRAFLNTAFPIFCLGGGAGALLCKICRGRRREQKLPEHMHMVAVDVGLAFDQVA